MSTSELHGSFCQKVHRFFDTLRERTLREQPDNIYDYTRSILSSVALETEKSLCSDIPDAVLPDLKDRALTIVVFGASGDLAKKKTFPALFQLYCNGLLPLNLNIVGYARSNVDVETWKRATLATYFTRLHERGCHVDAFLKRVSYISGAYDSFEDFKRLNNHICRLEELSNVPQKGGNRFFYFALPPTVFVSVCTCLSREVMPKPGMGWVRVVIEKPFGRDTETSAQLSKQLEPLFDETQLFRIDHYLGKEMVQNIIVTRFANRVFSALWNSDHIASVQIVFEETIGTEGRGGYFDKVGIIRDVVQNHLTQVLSLLAMEKPASLNSEDIRDEKVTVLKHVVPLKPSDCVLGQYTASEDGSFSGYLDDPTVPKDSRCPTFAMLRLYINNDRWKGVPFIIKAGKALERRFMGICIQFKNEIYPFGTATQRNELVIRAQPSEAMFLKLTAKTPGLGNGIHQTMLDLIYESRYNIKLPDAYESLIYEALSGNSTNFVRRDELDAAWRIYTPLLKDIDEGKVRVWPYKAGSRGPSEAYAFCGDSFEFVSGEPLYENQRIRKSFM